jgi:hypothetical protein
MFRFSIEGTLKLKVKDIYLELQHLCIIFMYVGRHGLTSCKYDIINCFYLKNNNKQI